MAAEHDLDAIKQYYGRVLASSEDLQTDACCTTSSLPAHLRMILAQIDDEVVSRFYGCGSPIPPALEGCTVVDLGCGTGRDVFLCAGLVGPEGRVIGVDMTEAQLEVGTRLAEEQCRRFGLPRCNVSFRRGYLEDLAAADIASGSVDAVISNCVINLAPDKSRVFSEIFRILKPGGELLFSDVFADRRLPRGLRDDPVLLGECLAGAMYIEDFRRLLLAEGVRDYRIVHQRPMTIGNTQLEEKIGMARFHSVTMRAFKLEDLEDRCEDYGQVAWYAGTIPHAPHAFRLDDHHLFETGRPAPVCGNTAAMLSKTRLARHFRIHGDTSTHFGLFPCGPEGAPAPDPESLGGCC